MKWFSLFLFAIKFITHKQESKLISKRNETKEKRKQATLRQQRRGLMSKGQIISGTYCNYTLYYIKVNLVQNDKFQGKGS